MKCTVLRNFDVELETEERANLEKTIEILGNIKNTIKNNNCAHIIGGYADSPDYATEDDIQKAIYILETLTTMDVME